MKISLLIFPVILVYLKRTPSKNASWLKNTENAKLFPFQALHGGYITINKCSSGTFAMNWSSLECNCVASLPVKNRKGLAGNARPVCSCCQRLG